MNFSGNPLVAWARVFLDVHLGRLRTAWQDNDRGASAVELAVIAAFLCAIAVFLVLVIQRFVHSQAGKINAPNP
jgi:Flp pilus assembly pilin Flp